MRRARFVHTLDFAWIEVLSVFRRKLYRDELAEERARAALTLLDQTPIRRHRASPFAGRVWQLRGALSPYDAAYVALAETLSAPLLTTDARLARAGGHSAAIVDASGPR